MNQNLLSFLPKAPDYAFDWRRIRTGQLGSLLTEMENTCQNAVHHAEGSVWTHTKMVCETLCAMAEFRALEPMQQAVVSLAALLHDVGKVNSTRLENGEWISPGHSLTGAHLVREILWKDFGLCGSAEKASFREAVCLLIRYHSTPVYIHSHTEPANRLMKIASNNTLTPLFSIRLACLLAEANILGRISENKNESLEKIENCRILANENSCCDTFPADHAFLENPRESSRKPYYETFDTPLRVIMLCGLPGSGKDEWIHSLHTSLPVISMDTIRNKLNIPKAEKGSVVSRAAQGEAAILMRAGKGFIWNATNLSETTRMRLIHQFESLGANVEIVYLETDWQKTIKLNDEKPEPVPIPVLEDMLSKLTPPERFEASSVKWIFC